MTKSKIYGKISFYAISLISKRWVYMSKIVEGYNGEKHLKLLVYSIQCYSIVVMNIGIYDIHIRYLYLIPYKLHYVVHQKI